MLKPFQQLKALVLLLKFLSALKLNAWTCEAYVKRETFVCAKFDYKYRLHNRIDYHQSTMERHRTLEPTECKYPILYSTGTDNPQLNAFDYSNSLTFFDDIQKRRILESKQPSFGITKLNTFYYGAFAWITNSLVLNSTLKGKDVCWDRFENIIEKDS